MRSSLAKSLTVSILVLVFISCLALPQASFAADEPRKVRQQQQPMYPELARNMRIQGAVKLEVVISPQGTIRSVKVLGGHPLLADAAEKAVKNWKYDPGQEETRTVTIDFKQ